jgi:CTP:molybdopterin cytidylyltransferase MocA
LRVSCQGVAIFLGDQPAVDGRDIGLLRRAFADRGAASVVVPTFAGQRGNPFLLDRHGIDEILRRGARFGCRHFISRYGDLGHHRRDAARPSRPRRRHTRRLRGTGLLDVTRAGCSPLSSGALA